MTVLIVSLVLAVAFMAVALVQDWLRRERLSLGARTGTTGRPKRDPGT